MFQRSGYSRAISAQIGDIEQRLRTLERHLDDHPDDLDMLLAGVEWIYQLRLAGGTAHSRSTDVQLARKYADAYLKAKGPQLALVVYLTFYAICLGLTWWFYLRRSPAEAGAPSLADARV